jgi:hypothetical protein
VPQRPLRRRVLTPAATASRLGRWRALVGDREAGTSPRTRPGPQGAKVGCIAVGKWKVFFARQRPCYWTLAVAPPHMGLPPYRSRSQQVF